MKFDLDALTVEVQRAQTVQSSAVMLLKKLTAELETIHAKLANEQADAAPLGELIDKLKTSTDGLAAAVADSADTIPVHDVVLNADDPTKPTVQVVMPEVLPEHVEVKAEQVVDTVDPASSDPQVVVTVTPAEAPADPAAAAPEAPAVVETIETAPTQVDVNVVAEPAKLEEIKNDTGVDVMEAVKEAVEKAEVQAEEAPVVSTVLNADDPTTPTVQVVTPEVLPAEVVVSAEQVVDKVDPASPEPQVVVTVEAKPEADPTVPAPAIAPVVDVIETPAEQTNVTVEVPAEVHEEIKNDTGVDVMEAVKEAVAEAATPAEPAPAPAPEPAPMP